MAKKDAYYFSHDANAQDDPKCMLLIDQLGMEGYGIFWALIEKLRSERDFKLPISIIPSFSKRWSTSPEKVLTVIKNYGLFELESDMFFSLRLLRNMIEKSEKARKSISYRWSNDTTVYERNTDVIRNDTIKVKESKEKKVKESKGFIIPTLSEVSEVFASKVELAVAETEAPRFFNHYESNGWMVGKNKMKSWQSAVNNWLSNKNKFDNGNSKKTNTGSPFNSRNGGFKILADSLRDDLTNIAAGRTTGFTGEI